MSNVLALHAVEPQSRQNPVIVGLDKYHIIAGWEAGIFSDKTLVYLALLHDSEFDPPSTRRLDFDVFIERWRGAEDPETGKIKKLTHDRLAKAIAGLYNKAIEPPTHMNIDFVSIEGGGLGN